MKKKSYLIILKLITIVCVIMGCIMHVYNAFSFSGLWEKEEDKSKISYENNLKEAFDNLEIDMHAVDLTIVEGSSYAIAYEGTERMQPKMSVENHTLKLTQKKTVNLGNLKKCKLTLQIPSDSNQLQWQLNMDASDVMISGVKVENVAFDMDAGDYDIENCTFQTLSVDTDAGDFNIRNCEIAKITVDVDAGDFNVENCKFGTAFVDADAADIDMLQCDFKDMQIDLDMGDVKINTSQKTALDLEVNVGTIKVNDKKEKKQYKTEQTDDDRSKLKIKNSLGDIDVVTK